MENALESINYEAFMALMQSPQGSDVKLDTNAALFLCRSGQIATKVPLAWLGGFWLGLVALVVTVVFFDWRYGPGWLFVMWLSARRSKRAAITATWQELKGKGSLPLEQRQGIYTTLVSQDMLVLRPPL